MNKIISIFLVVINLNSIFILTAFAQNNSVNNTHDKCLFATYCELASRHGTKQASKLMTSLNQNYTRRATQKQLVSTDNHFRFHYDITSSDAVPNIDKNGNSIPDFIDSANFYFEKTYDYETKTLGYLPPPPDNINTGQGGEGPEIDVYFCDLGNTTYGGAQPEEKNKISDNKLCAFMVLDNDYKGFATSGYAGLRVTIAHEFHHVIQLSGYHFDLSQRNFYEATSVMMEKLAEPTIPDYLNYVRNFLNAAATYPFSTHRSSTLEGYVHFLYFDYVIKLFSEATLREFWEEYASTGLCFTAIDNVLRRKGSNLENSYCEFARYAYQTGSRANDTLYFANGSKYPTMKATYSQGQTSGNIMLSGELYPLAFGLYRTVLTVKNGLKDTLDFLVTNGRSDIGGGGANVESDNFTIEVSTNDFGSSKPIYRSYDTMFYKFSPSRNSFCCQLITGGETQYSIATNINPQPFINDGGNKLIISFAIPNEEITSIKGWIYTSSMSRVAEIKQSGFQSSNEQLGAVWDGLDYQGKLAMSGVYIYDLIINNKHRTIGKFAVIGK